MTDWESCYTQNETPWDHGQPSPPLAEWLARTQPRGRALVPGCGRGHDVALAAAAGLEVLGLDIAPTAIARARASYPRHSECFLLGDLFAPPDELRGAFDWVLEHTCLSGMPPHLRPAYRDAVADLLRPGGVLAGIWYVNPDLDPGETGPPFGIPVEELDTLFAGWPVLEDYIPANSFRGRAGRERVRVLRRPE